MPRSPSSPPRLVIAPGHRHAPDAQEKIALEWCYVDGSAQGELTPDSPDTEWHALTQRCTTSPVTLLLPADAVSHFHLATPKGLKRSEWPLLLEDVTSIDPHTLYLHALQRSRGQLELMALSTNELQRWQVWAHSLALNLSGWAVSFLALPLPDQRDDASTLDDGEYRLFKGYGEPLASGAPTIEWLAWPRAWPTPPEWRERHWQEPITHAASASAEALRSQVLAWVAARLPAPLPFPGTSAKHRSAHSANRLTGQLGRKARLTAAALVLLIAINGALWLATEIIQVNHQAELNQATLAMRFSREIPPSAFTRLAERRDAIDALAERNQMLKEALGHALTLLDERQWPLSRQTIDGQQVALSWRPHAPPAQVTISQAIQRLSPLGDTQWQAAQGELTLTFALDSWAADVAKSGPELARSAGAPP